MKIHIALMMAALALTTPAQATIAILTYTGSASFLAHDGTTYTFSETGSGALSFDSSQTSITLGSGLTDFNFSTAVTVTASGTSGSFTYPDGSVIYGLNDLSDFEGTVVDGQLTGVSFDTNIKSVSYAGGNSVFFYDTYGFAGSEVYGSGAPYPSGFLSITSVAQVPEVASWAMMLGGFGMLGIAMRRRRAVVS